MYLGRYVLGLLDTWKAMMISMTVGCLGVIVCVIDDNEYGDNPLVQYGTHMPSCSAKGMWKNNDSSGF